MHYLCFHHLIKFCVKTAIFFIFQEKTLEYHCVHLNIFSQSTAYQVWCRSSVSQQSLHQCSFRTARKAIQCCNSRLRYMSLQQIQQRRSLREAEAFSFPNQACSFHFTLQHKSLIHCKSKQETLSAVSCGQHNSYIPEPSPVPTRQR